MFHRQQHWRCQLVAAFCRLSVNMARHSNFAAGSAAGSSSQAQICTLALVLFVTFTLHAGAATQGEYMLLVRSATQRFCARPADEQNRQFTDAYPQNGPSLWLYAGNGCLACASGCTARLKMSSTLLPLNVCCANACVRPLSSLAGSVAGRQPSVSQQG